MSVERTPDPVEARIAYLEGRVAFNQSERRVNRPIANLMGLAGALATGLAIRSGFDGDAFWTTIEGGAAALAAVVSISFHIDASESQATAETYRAEQLRLETAQALGQLPGVLPPPAPNPVA